MNERFENGELRDQEYLGCSHSPIADANAATTPIKFSIIIPHLQRAILVTPAAYQCYMACTVHLPPTIAP